MKKLLSFLMILTLFCTLLCGASFADEPERSADIIILYTSDVHCGIDQGYGYAGLQQVRDYLIKQGNDVILVDDGDNIQGEPIGTLTKGEALIDLMNQLKIFSFIIKQRHISCFF